MKKNFKKGLLADPKKSDSAFLGLADIGDYDSLDLMASIVVSGFMNGLHASPYRGFSAEYAEHHLYHSGESTRHIDWKVFARTDRLYTKRYEEETNLRAYLLLDVSASMYYPTSHDKIKFGVYASAALTYLLHKQRDAVGLFLFSNRIQSALPAHSTRVHRKALLEALNSCLGATPSAAHKTDITGTLHAVADRIPRRSLVIVLSDFLSADKKALLLALQHLRHAQHEVLLFHIMAHDTELNFNFPDKMYRFEHLEGTERIRVHPRTLRQSYRQYMNEWYKELSDACIRIRGTQFYSIDAQESFHRVLLHCLLKRSRMY